MSTPQNYRVFLSAVSNELASYRKKIAKALRRKGVQVYEQEHFHQGGKTLLEQLHYYIDKCDAVICLIGDQSGVIPSAEHQSGMECEKWTTQFRNASDRQTISYAQWEFMLAKYLGKDTYVFITADEFTPDNPSTESDDLRQLQADYRKWVRSTGQHWGPLVTEEELTEDVLVLPFPESSTNGNNRKIWLSMILIVLITSSYSGWIWWSDGKFHKLIETIGCNIGKACGTLTKWRVNFQINPLEFSGFNYLEVEDVLTLGDTEYCHNKKNDSLPVRFRITKPRNYESTVYLKFEIQIRNEFFKFIHLKRDYHRVANENERVLGGLPDPENPATLLNPIEFHQKAKEVEYVVCVLKLLPDPMPLPEHAVDLVNVKIFN